MYKLFKYNYLLKYYVIQQHISHIHFCGWQWNFLNAANDMKLDALGRDSQTLIYQYYTKYCCLNN